MEEESSFYVNCNMNSIRGKVLFGNMRGLFVESFLLVYTKIQWFAFYYVESRECTDKKYELLVCFHWKRWETINQL